LDFGLSIAIKHNETNTSNARLRITARRAYIGGITPRGGNTDRCKTELLRWRSRFGPEFSFYVFPNMQDPSKPMKDLRRSWAKALKDAGIKFFWCYDLRHSLASRLTQAGVSPVFVAQIIGHSSTSILSTYARAIDEYRRDAIHKLETLRGDHVSRVEQSTKPPNGSVQ
jgi:integrase